MDRTDRELLGAAARGSTEAFGAFDRLGAELERAGRHKVEERGVAAQAVLGTHSVLKYAVVEGAERYRRIMRALYLEHRHFGLRLRPEAVGARVRELFDLELDAGAVSSALDQLHAWGAVSREFDTSLARTARELRRNRYTYAITQAAERVEALLEALDQLADTVGALEGSRLPAIRDALRRIAQLLEAEQPDGRELRAQVERLTGEIERLHAGASDFMSRLNVVIARSEQIDEEEFGACKSLLIEHMQGFRRELRRHQPEIADAVREVDRLGAARMAALVVAAQELPSLPGLTPEELAARRHRDLLEQWAGVRSWFLDDGAAASPWAALGDKVVEAIRAILDIAERIIDRRTKRADRARACERLARLVYDAGSDEEATAIVRAALAFSSPRHVGVPEHDPDAVASPGQTSWLDAPPAPVTAHLRRPGARTPGAGRGAPIADTRKARDRALERARRERAELGALLERFGGLGRVSLSDLHTVNEAELRHLLHWIGRAFETPRDAAGARGADSSDGRAPDRPSAPATRTRADRPERPAGPLHDRRLRDRGEHTLSAPSSLDLQLLEQQQEATRALLETPFVGAEHPAFPLVRRHERELARRAAELWGYKLETTPSFARLLKRPSETSLRRPIRIRPGTVTGRQRPRDEWPRLDRRRSTLLFLTLAALERVGQQTVVGELARAVAEAGAACEPGIGVDFELRGERLAFADVLDLLCDWGVLRMDDGQRSSFAAEEQGDDEALFTIDRKRLASVLGDPFRAIGAGTLDDLLDDEHEYAPTEEGESLRRRHRLARMLAEDPVLYLERLGADELAYFQRQRGYLESRVEALTGLVAERRAEGTACIDRDRGLTDLPFPANSTRKQVALLLCDFLAGRETVTHEELREAVGRLVEQHGESWNRSADSLLDDAVDVLAGLDLLEPAEGGWRPLPLAGRFRSPTVNLARAR